MTIAMMLSPTALLGTFAAVFGLAIGSFLNVVIYRVPAGKSVVSPASSCPRCGTSIRGFDNIPVLSWLVLAGRCRDCRAPISVRYPLVELMTAVLFAAVAARFAPALVESQTAAQASRALVLMVAFLAVMAITVALAMIDLDTHTLPNVIVLPMYPVLIVLFASSSALGGDWGAFLRALIGMAVLGIFYLVVAVAVPGGMGFGDVKLAGVLGLALAYLGWGPLAVGAFGAFLLGGSFSIILLITRRASRKGGIPFGPWMLAGAWLGVFLGQPVWDAYLRIIGFG